MQPNSWLQQQAQRYPARPAFYWEDKSWSFSELNQLVQRYAAYYHQELPKDIHRVALFSENSQAMYFTILALWELGLEIQFLNKRLTPAEIKFQLTDAKTQWVIGEELSLPVGQIAFPDSLPTVTNENYIDSGYSLNAVASIMYTSGTTGQPKGVSQRFSNHQASAMAAKENMQLQHTDCWLSATPLYHISGLSILLRSLVLGLSVRLYKKFDVFQIAQDIICEKGTIISVVTKMLQDLAEILPNCPNFRHFLLGGGPVPEGLLQTCHEKGWSIIQSFGMTETCSQVIALPPEKAAQKIGSAGLPLPNVEIKVEQGEILLKGPSIVTEYLNQRGTNSWDDQGWFHTGDLGYLDEEGYLYLQSRLSELIISGGENIYPTEVEQVLLEHPKVLEAAVVGQIDETWGQIPVAYLLVSGELSVDELDTTLEKLAKYKRPKKIYLIKQMPRTASGKSLKRLFLSEERVNYIVGQLR